MRACIVIQFLLLNAAALIFPTPEFSITSANQGQSNIHSQLQAHGRIFETRIRAANIWDTRLGCSHKEETQQLEKRPLSNIELTPDLANKPKGQIAVPPTRWHGHGLYQESSSTTVDGGHFSNKLQNNHGFSPPSKRLLSQEHGAYHEALSRRNVVITPGMSPIKRTPFSDHGVHTGPIRLSKPVIPKRTISPGQKSYTIPGRSSQPMPSPGRLRTRRYSTGGEDPAKDLAKVPGKDLVKAPAKDLVKVPEEEMKKIYAKTKKDIIDAGINLFTPVIGISTQLSNLPLVSVCVMAAAGAQAMRRCKQIEQEQKDAISAAQKSAGMVKEQQDTNERMSNDIEDLRVQLLAQNDLYGDFFDKAASGAFRKPSQVKKPPEDKKL